MIILWNILEISLQNSRQLPISEDKINKIITEGDIEIEKLLIKLKK
jgi:hypothetical protein